MTAKTNTVPDYIANSPLKDAGAGFRRLARALSAYTNNHREMQLLLNKQVKGCSSMMGSATTVLEAIEVRYAGAARKPTQATGPAKSAVRQTAPSRSYR